MKIFSMDNKLHQSALKLVKLFYLSFLMIIMSVPLVTLGTAFSAGYYTYHKIYYCDDERSLARLYFASFKENFRETVGVSATILVLMGILYINFQAAAKGLLFFSGLKFVFLLLLILLAVFGLYYFSLAARFTNDVKSRLIATLSTALLNLPITLFLFVLVVAGYFCVTIIPITFLIAPAVLVMLDHGFCEKVFRFYESAQQEGI